VKRAMRRSCRISRLRSVTTYLVILLTAYVATSPISVHAAFTETVFGRPVDEYEQGMTDVEINVYSSDGASVKSESASSDETCSGCDSGIVCFFVRFGRRQG